MNFETLIFYFLSSILLFAALRVITARHPIHAALYLVLAFFTSAGLWLMLEAEFLAITLVLVYIGAVMVLFLFVVMMMDLDLQRLRQGFRESMPLAILVGGLMIMEMVMVLARKSFIPDFASMEPHHAADYSNTKELGRLLYTDYVYPFELAAVVLLIAIVAAIAITLRRRKNTKHQDPSEQVKARRADRIRMVSMPAQKPSEE